MKTTEITKTARTTKTILTATNEELSAGLAEIDATTEMMKTTGIWGANQGFPKQRFRNIIAAEMITELIRSEPEICICR